MRVSVKIKGLERFRRVSAALPPEVMQEVKKELEAGAMLIGNSYKTKILRGPKTGKVYKRGSVSHQASAPGEAPANDTGRLVAQTVTGPTKKGAFIASRANYAAALELGTRKMAARPAMVPAVEENRKAIERGVVRGVQRGIAKSARR